MSVKIPSKLGRRRSIGFRIQFNVETWIESSESMEFEWKISQDSPHCKSSPRFKAKQSVNLSISKDESSSCQWCTMSLYGEKKETKTCVLRIPSTWQNMQEDSRQVIGRFLARIGNKPNGEWDNVVDIMMINFCESGHPVFRGSSALERGDLKSKG